MKAANCSCFIIPSRVFKHLAEKTKNKKEREHLLDSALLSDYVRGHRSAREMMLVTNIAGEKRRTIYDCRHKQNNPPKGKLVRGEGDPPLKDSAVDSAYDSSGTTYDFYEQVLDRNSVDGQ